MPAVLETCSTNVRRRRKRCRFDSWVRKMPWRRVWQPTLVLLPGESQGWGSLRGIPSMGLHLQTMRNVQRTIKASNLTTLPQCPGLFASLGTSGLHRSRVHRWMHRSSKYARERGTVDTAKANWSSAIITGAHLSVSEMDVHDTIVALQCLVTPGHSGA